MIPYWERCSRTANVGWGRSRLVAMLFGIAVLLLGCGKSSTNETLNGRLETFVQEQDDGRRLTGVRTTDTHSVVVAPDDYRKVVADEHTIACYRDDYDVTAFSADGTLLGHFDMFTAFQGYYVGTLYDRYCFFFPETGAVVNGTDADMRTNDVCIKTEQGFQKWSYDGRLIDSSDSPFNE